MVIGCEGMGRDSHMNVGPSLINNIWFSDIIAIDNSSGRGILLQSDTCAGAVSCFSVHELCFVYNIISLHGIYERCPPRRARDWRMSWRVEVLIG